MLPRTHGSAIFQRGETQALVTTVLGTASRRAARRRPGGRVQQEVHARLQFPAVQRRRVPADPRSRPPRDRPRCPGRAQSEGRHSAAVEVPVHDPRRLRHPRIERLQQHGLRLRRHAVADGRRRADHRSGGRHLDRPGQGARSFRPADRHHGRRGPFRRHGLQGRRHRPRHHRHPARPEDRRHQRRDHPGHPGPGSRSAA